MHELVDDHHTSQHSPFLILCNLYTKYRSYGLVTYELLMSSYHCKPINKRSYQDERYKLIEQFLLSFSNFQFSLQFSLSYITRYQHDIALGIFSFSEFSWYDLNYYNKFVFYKKSGPEVPRSSSYNLIRTQSPFYWIKT